ncbi:DNRLRE domain-containing protein, partial [Candidatus Dojkabacteria bacterium]|nr:DNRLRE domain-containing protein [Candidatus Dojkabacteria bacterium]
MRKRLVNAGIFCLLILLIGWDTIKAAKTEKIKIGIKHDTYAEEGYPTTSPWNNRNFYTGYDLVYGKLRTRAYMNYSLRPLIDRNIAAEKILEAQLKIYQYYAPGDSYTLELRSVDDSWNQYSLNWNNQPDTTEVSNTAVSSSDGWKKIDIMEVVKEQLRTGDYDKGISLRTDSETSAGGIFWSTACEAAPSPPVCDGQHPYIEIEYSVNEPPIPPVLTVPEDNLLSNLSEQVFEWEAAEDPNGDAVYYQVEISTLPDFSSIYLVSDWLTERRFLHNFNEDGVYYWRVRARDEWMGDSQAVISQARRVEVDTTVPEIPSVETMPPFSFGDRKTVVWEFDSSCEKYQVKFQLQRFEGSIDNPENVVAVETENLGYEFANLEETLYFYRVKSIDVLGNESEWSEAVSSFQDHSAPVIKTLEATEKYISPLSSPGVQDFADISFKILDVSLTNWELIIEDSKRNVVYRKDGNEKDLSLRWPDSQIEELAPENFNDGVYFIYLKVIDEVGLADHSNVIGIEVDNLVPIKPKIVLPLKGSLLNVKDIKIEVRAEALIDNKVYINEKLFREFSDGRYKAKSDSFREGENKIRVDSVDRAGNSSSSEIKFEADWTPPLLQDLKLITDKGTRTIKLKIHGRGWQKAYIYNLAGIHKVISIEENPVTLVTNWTGSTQYSFY